MGKRTNRDPRIQRIKLAAVGVVRVAPRWSDTAGCFTATEFTKATYNRPTPEMRAAVVKYLNTNGVRRLPMSKGYQPERRRGGAVVGQGQPALVSTGTTRAAPGQQAAIRQQSWSDHAAHKSQQPSLWRRRNGELVRVG